MNQLLTKLMRITLVVVCILVCSMGAYANPIEPVTGIDLVTCELTLNVSDDTGGEYIGLIFVTITDIAGGTQYKYELTMQNYLFEFPVADTIIANTTYEVSVQFEEPGYALYDKQTGEIAERFHASGSGYIANLVLRDIAPPVVATPVSQNTANISEEAREEAAALWEAYYNAVKYMDGDEASEPFLLAYRGYEVDHAKRYAEYTNGSVDDWLEFSYFERYIRHETYIRTIHHLNMGTYDRFFGSEENFKKNSIGTNLRNLSRYTEEGAEAYENLMMWQYQFVKDYSDVYNFMTGNTYSSEKGGLDFDPIAESEQRTNEERDLIAQELEEIYNETAPTSNIEGEEDGGGIWSKTIAKAKSLWFTIILLIIVGGATVGVIVYRKRNDIKDIGNDD